MAEVYLARDLRLDRDVALKLLLPRYAGDPDFIERFRREAGVAARLSHPNIVHVYDRGEVGGTYYISMEYVPGRSLDEIIWDEAPLAPERIVFITRQILLALQAAHVRGLIHRDIKPENILVDAEGHVKVADFGIVRAVASGEATAAGAIIGTALYLSPEQAQGEPVYPASDLYSLGAVMYEMATKRPPFVGANAVMIAMQHVDESPLPPRELVPGLPEELERVILRALAKSLGERYGAATEFLADLEGWSSGRPHPSLSAVATTEVRRRSAEDGGMASPRVIRQGPDEAAQAVRKGTGGAAAAVGRPAASSEDPRPGRWRRVGTWVVVAVLVALLAAGGYVAATHLLDGVRTVVVPDLVGKTLSDAKAAGEDVGLTVAEGGSPENSADIAEGAVLRQRPTGSASTEAGGTILVWLSAGPPPVSVPNVEGMSRDDALAELTARGLKGRAVEEVTLSVVPGLVFAQDPAATQKVKPGSEVTISVAASPPVVAIPLDIDGWDYAPDDGIWDSVRRGLGKIKSTLSDVVDRM